MSVESNKSFFPWDVRFLSLTYIDKCELADVWADKHEWVLGKIIRWCCSCWDFGVNIRVKLSYHQLMSRFTSTCYCCCYAFTGCHWFKKQGRRVNRLPFVRVEVWKFNRFGKVILSNVSFTFEIFQREEIVNYLPICLILRKNKVGWVAGKWGCVTNWSDFDWEKIVNGG